MRLIYDHRARDSTRPGPGRLDPPRGSPVSSRMSPTVASHPLDNIQIARPCEARWEEMSGDARVRHCQLCKLNVYNLKFPSESEPLTQARNAVLKKDVGVVQAQQVASVSDAFLKILQTDGCIPTVQMYLQTKNVPAFGAVWKDVGAAQGTWLAEQAQAKGWTPDDTALVQCTDPSLGEDVNSMFPAAVQALKDGGFALADGNSFQLKCEFTPQKAQVPVTDWLTAHPNFKHILMSTIDDERMSGMTNAMRRAGKNEGESYLGIASGADELGQKEIKNGHESASIAFFPEKYGEWLIPMIEDVLAGHPGIAEAAVVGVPDEQSGEAVKAFVVRKDASLTAESVIAFCKENMTGYKVPRHIEFRDTLPKSPVGKILRRELRDTK